MARLSHSEQEFAASKTRQLINERLKRVQEENREQAKVVLAGKELGTYKPIEAVMFEVAKDSKDSFLKFLQQQQITETPRLGRRVQALREALDKIEEAIHSSNHLLRTTQSAYTIEDPALPEVDRMRDVLNEVERTRQWPEEPVIEAESEKEEPDEDSSITGTIFKRLRNRK